VIRFSFVTIFAVIFFSLTGCASMTSYEKSATSETSPCAENLIFFAPGKRIRYSTCEQQACGEPLDPSDVLVVEIENREPVDAAVEKAVGPNTRYMEEWYLSGPFRTDEGLEKAKRVFAAKGCNLLIIGDKAWRGALKDGYPRPGQELTRFRWGIYW
jgi:hypothetical protein